MLIQKVIFRVLNISKYSMFLSILLVFSQDSLATPKPSPIRSVHKKVQSVDNSIHQQNDLNSSDEDFSEDKGSLVDENSSNGSVQESLVFASVAKFNKKQKNKTPKPKQKPDWPY